MGIRTSTINKNGQVFGPLQVKAKKVYIERIETYLARVENMQAWHIEVRASERQPVWAVYSKDFAPRDPEKLPAKVANIKSKFNWPLAEDRVRDFCQELHMLFDQHGQEVIV